MTPHELLAYLDSKARQYDRAVLAVRRARAERDVYKEECERLREIVLRVRNVPHYQCKVLISKAETERLI